MIASKMLFYTRFTIRNPEELRIVPSLRPQFACQLCGRGASQKVDVVDDVQHSEPPAADHLVMDEVQAPAQVFNRPAHPYTLGLLAAVPEPDPMKRRANIMPAVTLKVYRQAAYGIASHRDRIP